ncbi:hypothetical protein K1719_006078 [Acacia pycnantha]|nr:hypothetical protein K1719_006078 [Acacia pycnantha]
MADNKIIYWNVRGACGKNLAQHIRVACLQKHLALFFLAETKCESLDRLRAVSNLGYDGLAYVPSIGRSRGILAAWKSSIIDVNILRLDRQLIHLRCRFSGGNFFTVSAVYLVPDSAHKQWLWSDLRGISISMTELWTVLGDFNDVASPSEKTGGLGYQDARFSLFTDRIQGCNLFVLGASGPKFTWKGPKHRGGRRLYERLDRVLANEAFLSSFTGCSVQLL